MPGGVGLYPEVEIGDRHYPLLPLDEDAGATRKERQLHGVTRV